jgi:hypothetical protein
MDIIEIKTLIDITNTRVNRPNQGTQLEVDQQRNFVTLNQCVELRSVVFYNNKPTVETVDVKDLSFGSVYKGKHSVWTFIFNPDRAGVYRDDEGNEIGFLLEDVHGVPVIKNLTETINIDKAIFDLKDSKFKNTIITALPGNT